jgi:hypothetical protein
MKAHVRIFLAIFAFSLASFSKGLDVDALLVVDIDGTIGEQTAKKPDFIYDGLVLVPGDPYGNFYLFPNALNFLKTLFRWKEEVKKFDQRIEIALFTMGTGIRNAKIRDFIERELQLKEKTLGLFDYSNAIFSDKLVQRWKTKDPTLPAHWREYFDGLTKPIVSGPLPNDAAYYKDLSRLLPFYPGLKLSNIRLVDDNDKAVPDTQKHQLFVFGDDHNYSPYVEKLQAFLATIN